VPLTTRTLIWLFPVAFMLHDFEEIILGEPWLKKNADDVLARLPRRVPGFLRKQIRDVSAKSAGEFAFSVGLIFALVSLSAYLALEVGQYTFFLLASGGFFLHGFMHVGQAVLLRRYVPAVITSLVIAIPYGLLLFPRLIQQGVVTLPSLLVYFVLAIVLIGPFIFVIHFVGAFLYKSAVRLLIGS
jgi:hypothetical protein